MGAEPQFPYRFIAGLPEVAKQQLWRNFQYLSAAITGAAFLVVNADGSGDYTTLNDAINSFDTSAIPKTVLIYVVSDENAGTGTNTIDVPSNGYNYVIMGDDPGLYQISGFSGAGDLTFIGMRLNGGDGDGTALINYHGTVQFTNCNIVLHSQPLTAGGVSALLRVTDCVVGDNTWPVIADGATDVTLYMRGTWVGTDLYGGNVHTQTVEISDCVVNSVVATSLTVSHGSTSANTIITDSVLGFANGDVLTFAAFGEDGESFVLQGCQLFSAGAYTVTFAGNIGNNVQVTVEDCTTRKPTNGTFTLNVTTVRAASVSISNNNLPNCILTTSGTNNPHVHISGTYRNVAIGTPKTAAYIVAATNAAVTGISVTADDCVVVGTVYAANIGVSVSGNNNLILVGGTASCTTPTANSGTGNHINGLTDPLAIHTGDTAGGGAGDIDGTFPDDLTVKSAFTRAGIDSTAIHTSSTDPWLAGTFPNVRTGPDFTQLFQAGVQGRVSADMIRHIAISATKPTSNQALKYNATTKRLEYGTVAGVAVPFLVVDAGGAGDFTSIKSAIDSLSTNATANDISGIVYVKQSSAAYSDGSSTVDVGGKQVIIIGQGSATAVGMFTDTGVLTMPLWTFGGFVAASGTGNVAIQGMELGATNLTTSANVNFQLDRCKLASLTNAASISNCNIRDCYFTAAIINVTTFAMSNCIFKGCRLDAGWVVGSATVTCSAIVRFESCLIKGQATTTVSYGNSTGGDQWEFVGNALNVSATTTWTFNKSGTEDHYLWANNTRNSSQTGILTLSFAGSGHGPQVVFDGNDLPYTDLTFANSATDMALSISGVYRRLTLAQTAVSVNAVLDMRGSSSLTALTLSSGAVGGAISVTLIGGTSTTGYSIAAGANNNLITIGNLAGVTTTGTDSGSGNTINAVLSGGTSAIVGTGDFRHPFLLSDL